MIYEMRSIRLAMVASILGLPTAMAQGTGPRSSDAPATPPAIVVEPPPTTNPHDLTSERRDPRPQDTRPPDATTQPQAPATVPPPPAGQTAPAQPAR